MAAACLRCMLLIQTKDCVYKVETFWNIAAFNLLVSLAWFVLK